MKKENNRSSPITVILPDDLRARIKELSAKSRLSPQDIIRQAVMRGLPQLQEFFGDQKRAA